MKLLLTSGGITNSSIHEALLQLLGKPIADCKALAIPTAAYGHPAVEPENVWRFLSGQSGAPLVGLGWQSVGVLELTALPTIALERWQQWVRAADVLLVDGGDAVYLSYWLQRSGLLTLLPELDDLVWVGISAGSMVMAPRIGDFFTNWQPPNGASDQTLGWLDFAIFPHLGLFSENNLANAKKWSRAIGIPGYAIDEQTAIQVVADQVTVVSEGSWYYLEN